VTFRRLSMAMPGNTAALPSNCSSFLPACDRLFVDLCLICASYVGCCWATQQLWHQNCQSFLPACDRLYTCLYTSELCLWCGLLLGNTAVLPSNVQSFLPACDRLYTYLYTSEMCLMCRLLLGLMTMKMSTWKRLANPVALTRMLSPRLLALCHQAKAKPPMESLTLYVFLITAEKALDHACALHEVVSAEVYCHVNVEYTCLYTCLQPAQKSGVMQAILLQCSMT